MSSHYAGNKPGKGVLNMAEQNIQIAAHKMLYILVEARRDI